MVHQTGCRKWMNIGCVIFLLVGTVSTVSAAQRAGNTDTTMTIPVDLVAQGLGKMEMEILSKGGKTYLPFTTIFKALRLKFDYLAQEGIIRGYIVGTHNPFEINISQGRVSVRDSVFPVSANDYIVTRSEFYLRTDLYGRLFGLGMQYSPAGLIVRLRTSLKLPAFLDREREQARNRQSMLIRPVVVDTAFPLSTPLLGVGRLDWNLRSSVSTRGQPRYYYDLALGNAFLGGDLQTRVQGEVHRALTTDDVRGRLGYAFLDKSLVRQVVLGDIFETGILPLATFGVEITNRPAPRRLVFGIDEFADRFGPKQTTDFYVQDRLTETGVSTNEGDLQFSHLLPYGITDYEVRSYDEFGGEQVKKYHVNVPLTLLPPGEVDYSLVGGALRMRPSRESAGDFAMHWGVNSRLTVGGGVDYINSEKSRDKWHPSLSSTVRITSLLTGEMSVAPTAFSQATLTLQTPSLAGGTLSYQRFARNLFYSTVGLIEEKLLDIYIPLVYSNSRFGFNAAIRERDFSEVKEWSPRASVSLGFGSVTFRVTDAMTISDSLSTGSHTVIQHDINPTINVLLPKSVVFRASGFYDQLGHNMSEIQLSVFKGFGTSSFAQLFYERSFTGHLSQFGLQFTYYFPFAYFRSSISRESEFDEYRSGQAIGGSIGVATLTGDFIFDHLNNRVGLGGIMVHPFLDANGNGIQDNGEQFLGKAKVFAASISGSRTPLTFFPGLGYGFRHSLPYEKYNITVDPESFDDPMWTPRFTSLSVVSSPDQFQFVPLPVLVGGVVRGSVREKMADSLRPVEGIEVKIRSVETADGNPRVLKTTITVSTGEFEFIGIAPGRYVVYVDNEDMIARMGKVVQPSERTVEIITSTDGSEVTGVDFVLK